MGASPRLRLGGHLADIAGEMPDYHFQTIRQAGGLLRVNHPDILGLRETEVVIRLNEREVGPDFYDLPLGPGSIVEILPASAGGSEGTGKIILGAVLTVASFFVAGPAGFSLLKIGAGMLFKGIAANMETPEEEDPHGGPFQGPRTTTGEGQIVPLLYGYSRVSGALIHRTIDTEDV